MEYSQNTGWEDEALIDMEDEFISETEEDFYDESEEEIYAESEDEFYGSESEEESVDEEEALPFFRRGGISGIRKLIRRKPRSNRSLGSFKPGAGFLRHSSPKGRYNIPSAGSLSGVLNTNRGPFSFRLPPNIATKDDLKKLAASIGSDIKKVSVGVRKNSEVIKNNVAGIRKLNSDLKVLDKKNSAVEMRQNKLIGNLNKGYGKLKKDQDQLKQQLQMNSMLSMLMQPKLESLTLSAGVPQPDGAVAHDVKKSKFKSDFLPLIMMMTMSGGSEGSSSGNMMNNPMMMFVMLEAFKD